MRAHATQLHTLVMVVCGLWYSMPMQGQSGSEYPRTPCPYPASYDAEIADPDVHRVLLANLQNSPSAGAAYDPQHQPHSVALLPN